MDVAAAPAEISIPEATLLLGRTYHQVLALACRGTISARRDGRKWLLRRADVEALAQAERARTERVHASAGGAR